VRTEDLHASRPRWRDVRIYCEALEQGAHYLAPAVEDALRQVDRHEVTVRLVKLKSVGKKTTAAIAEKILPSLRMKDPDGLITIVSDGGSEFPIAFLEFSTAVQTEDHDQQRFDAFVAAGRAGIPFIKVYAKRSSSFVHGGKVDFDGRATFRLMQQTFQTPAFEISWTTDEGSRRAIAHPDFPSCPSDRDQLAPLLASLFRCRFAYSDGLLGPAVLRDPSVLPDWAREQVESNRDAVPLPKISPRSTRLRKEPDGWTLKFNRWGHAMDPERGMSWYLRSLLREPLRGVIHDRELKRGDVAGALDRLAKATGLEKTDGLGFGGEVELSQAISESLLNRVGLAIFGNCCSFVVADGSGNPISNFFWDERPVQGKGGIAANGTLLRRSSFSPSEVTEDEVTYSIAHSVLRKHGFRLIAVSYPGAQGDFAVLGAEKGRRRTRTYPDVVAFRPGGELVIVEAKARFGTPVIRDSERVRALISNPRWEAEFRDQVRSTVAGRDLSSEPILMGVGHWKGVRDEIEVPADADFAIAIGADAWRILGIAPKGIPPAGSVDLPELFLY
jgi:hypothetical protein